MQQARGEWSLYMAAYLMALLIILLKIAQFQVDSGLRLWLSRLIFCCLTCFLVGGPNQWSMLTSKRASIPIELAGPTMPPARKKPNLTLNVNAPPPRTGSAYGNLPVPTPTNRQMAASTPKIKSMEFGHHPGESLPCSIRVAKPWDGVRVVLQTASFQFLRENRGWIERF